LSLFLEPALLACRVALEKKGKDVVLLDIRNTSTFADYFVLITRRSPPHGKALAQALQEALDNYPLVCRGIEGYPYSPWILLDYYGLVVHIFEEEDRDYYGLDRRWSSAPARRFQEGFVS
jgi:ribosome-associated protein